jgi:hypothetical protein
MPYELAVGETGHQGRISHPSAPRLSRSAHAASHSLITNHHSPITGFLIGTPAIRNASNSFAMNASSRSNRHSSGPNFDTRNSTRTSALAANGRKLLTKPSVSARNLTSFTSSISFTSFTSHFHFAIRTTLPEVPYLHPNLLCYSPRVTRVPPIGPRESAPARSHGYGVVVSSPRDGSFTGAFPHKFKRSTGLIGSARPVLRAIREHGNNQGDAASVRPIGFCSPESSVDEKDVDKEMPCAS